MGNCLNRQSINKVNNKYNLTENNLYGSPIFNGRRPLNGKQDIHDTRCRIHTILQNYNDSDLNAELDRVKILNHQEAFELFDGRNKPLMYYAINAVWKSKEKIEILSTALNEPYVSNKAREQNLSLLFNYKNKNNRSITLI